MQMLHYSFVDILKMRSSIEDVDVLIERVRIAVLTRVRDDCF
jgi:hypothetical protein